MAAEENVDIIVQMYKRLTSILTIIRHQRSVFVCLKAT